MRLATVGCRCAEVDGEDLHEHFEGEWPGTESSSQVIEKETSSGTVTMLSAVQCCERRNAVSGEPNAVTHGEYTDVGDGHLSLEAI